MPLPFRLRAKLHPFGYDLMLAPLLAVVRFPPLLLESPFDQHLLPLHEILRTVFRRLPKRDHIDETHFFLDLVALIEPAIDGEAKRSDWGPTRGVTEFWCPR